MDSLTAHVKSEQVYACLLKDVEARFYISSKKVETLVLKRKNNKLIALLKDNLIRRITKEFVALR